MLKHSTSFPPLYQRERKQTPRWPEWNKKTHPVEISCRRCVFSVHMWIPAHVCGNGCVLLCDCMHMHVCVGVCVCARMCVYIYMCALPSDLWCLSSSASSLSLLAWRMNGPLSALLQPLLLALSLKLPFFFSVLPFSLSYLPTCSSSACTLSSSLPFTLARPLLCSLSWFDPYFPCFVTPPLHCSSNRLISSVDLGCVSTKSWPLIWFQETLHLNAVHLSQRVCVHIVSPFHIKLMFQWVDVEFALSWQSWEQTDTWFLKEDSSLFLYFRIFYILAQSSSSKTRLCNY